VADFARLDEVRRLADQIRERVGTIDVLMNNAGGTFAPSQAVEGEPNFRINYLAPFLLTNLLHDRLAAATDGALVLNTSSVANLFGRVRLDDLDGRRSQSSGYATSKLMNILFTRGIAQRWAEDGIVSAAVHPGAVASNFGADSWLIGLAFRSPLRHVIAVTPEQGASPLIKLAQRGADPAINGVYFNRHRPNGRTSPQARNQALIDGLWDASLALTR
jgi:NAD(P)-dependent dehydrogenase (short-subunit alcohol dehydrogenase family)